MKYLLYIFMLLTIALGLTCWNMALDRNRLLSVPPKVITETKYEREIIKHYIPVETSDVQVIGMHIPRLKYTIKAVCNYLDIPNADSYVDLLLYTALIESRIGIYRKQLKGPALSPFQMEPATEKSIQDIYLKRNPKWKAKIDALKGDKAVVSHLENNLEYAIAMSLMYYLWRDKNPPKAGDWKEISVYHKKHFNTYKGKTNANKGYQLALKVLKGY